MLIKKILRDTEISEYIGLVILFAVSVLYIYYYPETIAKSETSDVTVVLSCKPNYRERNGDNVSNIFFTCRGYDNDFSISNCALDLIQKQDILKLSIGDSLKLTVEATDLLYKKKSFIHHTITICGIESYSQGKILDLDEYNQCKRQSWKSIWIFAAIFLFILAWKITKYLNK